MYRRHSLVTYAKRLSPVLAVVLVVFDTWHFQYEVVNGFIRNQRPVQCREEMVSPKYLDSTSLAEVRPALFWRDKGYLITALFENKWGEKVLFYLRPLRLFLLELRKR